MIQLFPDQDVLVAGLRVGRLTAIGDCKIGAGRRKVLFRCDCGSYTAVPSSAIKRGFTKSCGCLHRESASANGKRRRTHGKSVGPTRKLYDVWRQMHRRCYDSACKDYPMWGGRGIGVCHEWSDVAAFCAWAESSGYREGLTIERVDNMAGYSPGNCQWIENERQAENTRRRRPITVNGETMGLCDASRRFGVPYTTIVARLNRGLSGEEAVCNSATTS